MANKRVLVVDDEIHIVHVVMKLYRQAMVPKPLNWPAWTNPTLLLQTFKCRL